MVVHPQDKVFQIEDFDVKDAERTQKASALLKARLLEYLENVQTEVRCCPCDIRRLKTAQFAIMNEAESTRYLSENFIAQTTPCEEKILQSTGPILILM